MNQVLIKAFNSLTTTCNTTALHPSDEDRIKVTLKTLHKNGINIDDDSLENWLLENKWQKTPVKNVMKWAEAVSTGGRVQIKNKSMAQTEKQIWDKLSV
jgi:hypothetical protein